MCFNCLRVKRSEVFTGHQYQWWGLPNTLRYIANIPIKRIGKGNHQIKLWIATVRNYFGKISAKVGCQLLPTPTTIDPR
jgi:hypothetical protein